MMQTKDNKKLLVILLSIVLFMFVFGFLLVPIYNSMCKALGINGKTSGVAESRSSGIDKTRTITVEFVTNYSGSLHWQFYPKVKKVKLHPGEMRRVSFYAENDSNRTMMVQAIPSITPGIAAKYFKKTECFCFTQQTLASHEAMDMPLLFHLDRGLPKNVTTVTLAYTLYDVSSRMS